MLTLNLNLLYTVVNVLILFLLLRKFLYKPVMGIIAQRQKQVDDALNAAETSKKEAAAAMNAAQDKLRNVDTEAAARRETYEQQAETAKQQLLAEAQKQADAIVAEGKAAAEAERQHKLREADAQTTALARAMCEKLLSRNLTEQDDSRLLDDLLEKAGAEQWQLSSAANSSLRTASSRPICAPHISSVKRTLPASRLRSRNSTMPLRSS